MLIEGSLEPLATEVLPPKGKEPGIDLPSDTPQAWRAG